MEYLGGSTMKRECAIKRTSKRFITMIIVLGMMFLLSSCGDSKESQSISTDEAALENPELINSEIEKEDSLVKAKIIKLVALQNPPYEYLENGEVKGIAVDIVKEGFKRMGYETQITQETLTKAIELLKTGESDGVFTVYKNDEIENFTEYSEAILMPQIISLFVLKDADITYEGELEKMTQYNFGGPKSVLYGEKMDMMIQNKMLNYMESDTCEQSLEMLLNKELDVLVCDKYRVLSILEQRGQLDAVKELTPELQSIPSYIAFSKSSRALGIREAFDQVIEEMQSDGSIATIMSKPEWGISEAEENRTIDKWIMVFQPSALSQSEQKEELNWFRKAAEPLRGTTIKVASETLPVHEWEKEVLAKAFEEITGIEVIYETIHEGDVVKNITEQIMTGRMLYQGYVNDSDLIGTHLRLNRVVNLTEYMETEGKVYTNPYLDLNDFLNLEFVQDYDGNILQLPDQQFANLYWFRYDWFTDLKTMADFKSQYGYELGVPINWAAYEDIAEFFTGRTMKNPDGSVVKAYGHVDVGELSVGLGWRFTDAWLSIAGVGDTGLPNGSPVDEWGIRTEDGIPVGSSVERGGALDGPAAVYAFEKFVKWLNLYAPPESKMSDPYKSTLLPARGDIAQSCFQYATFLENYVIEGGPMVDKDGKPVWRFAPSPHGKYWREGMKVGYQDAGCWTIPSNVKGEYRDATWLFAQFCCSKTVSVKKFLVSGSITRHSTSTNSYVLENAYRWGGLVEFYNSPEEKKWTPTGKSVPNYPALSGIWWSTLARGVKGELTPQETMTMLANKQDEMMGKLKLEKYSPQLNPIKSREYWLEQPGAPYPEKEDQKPETIPYDELIKRWQ